MAYDKLPDIKFEKEVTREIVTVEIDPKEKKIEERMRNDRIEVNLEEFIGGKNQPLKYEGRKIIAYIRDQTMGIDEVNKTSNYKYHLCFCKALQEMKDAGKIRRYIVSRKNNNIFKVNDISEAVPKMLELRMDLCGWCRHLLINKRQYFRNFNLKGYFKKYDAYLPKEIRRVETITSIQEYQPNQAEISNRMKAAMKYNCQECGVHCKDRPQLLHLHHIDSDKSHNYTHNFAVLCIDCHSRQFNHQHLIRKYRSEIKLLQDLRKNQGIFHLRVK